MPLGSRHEVVGLLLHDDDVLVLEAAEGGVWRLDLGWRQAWRARGLIGHRVRVTGVRDGFDLLAVETIERNR